MESQFAKWQASTWVWSHLALLSSEPFEGRAYDCSYDPGATIAVIIPGLRVRSQLPSQGRGCDHGYNREGVSTIAVTIPSCGYDPCSNSGYHPRAVVTIVVTIPRPQ